MKVWWCEVHGAQQTTIEARPEGAFFLCWKKDMQPQYLLSDCRMVEMQLVPANARIVSGETEHCDECGQAYDEVYALPDALWARIHERAPAGLLCPACALNRVVALAPVSDPTKTAT